jgi:hypothetical protein
MKKVIATCCRWGGRVTGIILIISVVMLAIGEGLPDVLKQPISVQIGFLAMGCILLGILAGWRWELAGGVASLAGWLLFAIAVVGSPRHLNCFIEALALPGALYVASALLRRSGR